MNQGYSPAEAIASMKAPNAIRVPTLTASLDRIEKTLAAATERAEIAAVALGRISIGEPTPLRQGRDAQCQAPSTVETRLNDIVEGAEVLLGKIELLAKRLNSLV